MFREKGEILYLVLTIVIISTLGVWGVENYPYISVSLMIAFFLLVKLEQAQLIGNALEVNELQFPHLFKSFEMYRKQLGIKHANLYIKQDPYPNAFTIGFPKASIVLSSTIVRELSEDEILFVIAHELGHVKASHNVILTFINPLGNGIWGASYLFSFWQRKAEYSSDKCALILTKKLEPAFTALLKISIGPSLMKDINVAQYKEQIIGSNNKVVGLSEWLSDHPLTTHRVKSMIKFWKRSFSRQ